MTRAESRREQISRLRNSLNPLYLPTEGLRSTSLHRLPGTPALLPGEAFSSWHWRLQTFLRLSAKALQSVFGTSGPTYWIDTGAYRLDIELIAHTAMHTMNSLEALTWPQGSLLSTPGYACLTTTPLRQRPIYRYCETCLREDPIPYIRLLWRLACAYVCPTHGTVLRELCPKCHQPFELPSYKSNQTVRSLRHCHACGTDLSDVAPSTLPEYLRYFVLGQQAKLLQLISGQSRLMEAWPDLQVHARFHFESVSKGVVDLESSKNVRLLFARVLSDHLLRTTPPPGRGTRTLGNYLLRIPLCSPSVSISNMPVAFDGQKVFGQHALAVCKHLVGRHDLWGSTHWWPLKHMEIMLTSDVFDAKDFARAMAWSSKLARSGRRERPKRSYHKLRG